MNQFDSKLAFSYTKISMEEIARTATTLLAVAASKRAFPTRSRGLPSAPCDASHGPPSEVYPHGGFTPDVTLRSLQAAGEGMIPHLPGYEERDRTVSFKDSLAEHTDSDSIVYPNTPPKVIEQPTRARAFQLPFKLSASCMSAREAVEKKYSNPNRIKKNKKEDEMFILNALETDNELKVACSVAALIMFFHYNDFKGKTSRGDAFEDCDKYRPAPLSDMWQNILLKRPAEKLSIAMHTILTHQEVCPSTLGGVPPFRKNTSLTGTLMDNFNQGHWACR
jgi:hypothetical protein